MTNEESLAKAEECEKWAALFKAKAEGKVIQYFGDEGPWRDSPYCDSDDWAFNDLVRRYRIKPEPKKSVGYRRYLYKSPSGEVLVLTWHVTDLLCVSDFKRCCYGFIRWIDNEIQYEEYEEE